MLGTKLGSQNFIEAGGRESREDEKKRRKFYGEDAGMGQALLSSIRKETFGGGTDRRKEFEETASAKDRKFPRGGKRGGGGIRNAVKKRIWCEMGVHGKRGGDSVGRGAKARKNKLSGRNAQKCKS